MPFDVIVARCRLSAKLLSLLFVPNNCRSDRVGGRGRDYFQQHPSQFSRFSFSPAPPPTPTNPVRLKVRSFKLPPKAPLSLCIPGRLLRFLIMWWLFTAGLRLGKGVEFRVGWFLCSSLASKYERRVTFIKSCGRGDEDGGAVVINWATMGFYPTLLVGWRGFLERLELNGFWGIIQLTLLILC